jgi:protein TonB
MKIKPVSIKFVLPLLLVLFAAGFVQAQTTPKVLPVAEFYEGGQEAMLADIQKMLVYPPMAKRNRVQGECIVAFVLEENGKISNQQLIKAVGAGTGEEAMRIVKGLKFKAPGYRFNATVPVKFTLPKPGA